MSYNNESVLNDWQEKLLELEVCLNDFEGGLFSERACNELRSLAKDTIILYSNGVIDSNISFSNVLKSASKNPKVKRFAALLMLRTLNVEGLLKNSDDDKSIEQNVSQLVETALPDFDKKFKFSDKKQTFDKIILMESVHSHIMDKIIILKNIPHILKDIVKQKESVFKAINNKQVKSYLRYYDYDKMISDVKVFL